jgi:branched-chain amino acid transport system permease protein/neutral amino acid transport system permease protein
MNTLLASFGFGLVTASILAIAAVGFTLQFSVTNILNLAFGDIMTLCAYAGYRANVAGASVWAALLLAGVTGAAISVVLNRTLYAAFVRRGTPLWGMVIVTVAVALMIQNLFLGLTGPHYFTYRLPAVSTARFAGLVLTDMQLEIIALAVVAMSALHLVLNRTRLGKAMRATASNVELARSCGINTGRVIDVAWLISGALCGVASVALVMNTVSFQATTGSDFLVVIVAAAVLGGVGAPYGAMLGALIVGVVTEEAAAYFNPALKNVFAFAILVIVLLFRPQGLFSRGRRGGGAVA